MNIWKRRLLCVGGTFFALGFGTTGLGCSTGTYTVRVQITPMGAWLELQFSPLDEFDQYDLDSLDYRWFEHEGQMYRFYPQNGWLFDPDTNRLYQLDDPSWQLLRDWMNQLATDSQPRSTNSDSNVIRKAMGVLSTSSLLNGSETLGHFSISLSLMGDTPLPIWDVERWPTLDREIYIFPDGVSGSPDPIRLQLSGDENDVIGYLVELGLTSGGATINGEHWSIMIDEEQQLADIFYGESLLTTVLIN